MGGVDRVHLVAGDADDPLLAMRLGGLVERHPFGPRILEILHRRMAGGAEAGLARVVEVLEHVARAAARRAGAGEEVEDPFVLRRVGMVRRGPLGVALEVACAALGDVGRHVRRIVVRRQDGHADVDPGLAGDRRRPADDEVLGRAAQVGNRRRQHDLADRIGRESEAAIGAGEGAGCHEVGLDVHVGTRNRRAGRAAALDGDETGDVRRSGAGGERKGGGKERSDSSSAGQGHQRILRE